jgi:hypothetical protein
MFMKKPLRYLLTCVLLMAASGAWANTVTFDATSDSSATYTLIKNGITITISNTSSTVALLNNGSEYRIYKNSIITLTSASGNITNVVFNCTANNTTKYGPGCFTDPTVGTYTYSNKVGTWTGDASSFALTASSNQVRCTSIVVTYTSNLSDPNLAFAPTSVSMVKGNTATVTFTKATNATPTFTIDESIATYNSTTGVITGVSIGKTTLKASCDATSTYSAGDVSCTVVVLSPTLTTVTVTTTEPYNEPFTTNFGSFTSDGVQAASTDVWSHNSTYSCAYATARISSTAYESSSKLTSPIIDLSNSSIKGVKLTFDHAGYSGSDMTKLTLWVKETSATSWTQLTIPTYFTSYTFVSSGDIILDAYAGKKIQVAFQYESTTAAAGTWEIKNFVVTGSATTNINVIKNDDAKDAPVYSTSGIRMNGKTLPAGVYVKNGKKFVVK